MRNYIFTLFALTFFVLSARFRNFITRLFITQKTKRSLIIYLDSSNLLWVLEDSGNENEIYGLNFENGTIEKH
jgi:hypothetical protein